MNADNLDLPDDTAQTPISDEVMDSVDGFNEPDTDGNSDNSPSISNGNTAISDRLKAQKNAKRQRLLKLREVAPRFGLSAEEVKSLAVSGMIMPDIFDTMKITDIGRRIDAVEEHSASRLQYTNLIVPPIDIESYIEGRTTVKIDSKQYLRNLKSLSDLMVAVRGSAKILDGTAAFYAEQHAFHRVLLRLVVERQQSARVMRNSPPKYLIDFARLLESLGCDRSHLRSIDGRFVSMVRDHLGFSNAVDDSSDGDETGSEKSYDDDAAAFQSWLAEGDAVPSGMPDNESDSLNVVANNVAEDDDEYDRLARATSRALMRGDMDEARVAFANLEAFQIAVEDEFGSSEDTDSDVIVSDGAIDSASDSASDVTSESTGDVQLADRALPAKGTSEGDGGVVSADDRLDHSDDVSADVSLPINALPIKTPSVKAPSVKASEDLFGESEDRKDLKDHLVPVSLPEPVPMPEPLPASDPEPTPEPIPASEPGPEPKPFVQMHIPTKSFLKGWGLSVSEDADFPRVTGVGRLSGENELGGAGSLGRKSPFGGVFSTASATPEVIPMWARQDRPASTGERLTMNDWYRFEVGFGPYALVHMPRKLTDFVPVSDQMFPPYLDLER